MNINQIDATTHTDIIRAITDKLLANYVFPEIAERICNRLQKHLEDFDYKDITDGKLFATVLTNDIQEISNDKHLVVRWFPEPLPEGEASQLQNDERLEQFKLRAKLDNYGFHKVERLSGNIGYLDIRYFTRPSWGSGETAVAAMNFISNTNALIVDLRKCQGGIPGMVALISSYLFNEEPVHVNNFYWRAEDFTQQFWTLPYIPGKQYGEKPIFVLTSKSTFSAGEGFSYNLKARKHATLIGETTAGGAHPGSPFRLNPHFEMFIPMGRTINPITNKNWEGQGVTPDIQVTSEQALSVAHKLALELVIDKIGESSSIPYRKLLEQAQVALDELNIASKGRNN